MGRTKKNKYRYKVTENKDKILKAIRASYCKSDVCRALNIPLNGSGNRLVNRLIEELDADISHFDGGKKKRFKYPVIEKTCPVCKNKFKASKGSPREKQTCSYACSNTLLCMLILEPLPKQIPFPQYIILYVSKPLRKQCCKNYKTCKDA